MFDTKDVIALQDKINAFQEKDCIANFEKYFKGIDLFNMPDSFNELEEKFVSDVLEDFKEIIYRLDYNTYIKYGERLLTYDLYFSLVTENFGYEDYTTSDLIEQLGLYEDDEFYPVIMDYFHKILEKIKTTCLKE